MMVASGLPRSGSVFATCEFNPVSSGTGGAAASNGLDDAGGGGGCSGGRAIGSTAAATVAKKAPAISSNRIGRRMVRIRPWLPGPIFPPYKETHKKGPKGR